MATETTTRYLGTCPCCMGVLKVRKGLLVHHGYKRPGWGYIVGDCHSVGMEPHETSPEAAKSYLKVLGSMLARNLGTIQELPTRPELSQETSIWSHEARAYVKEVTPYPAGTLEHARILKGLVLNLENLNRQIRQDMARLEGMIASWEPRPLMTVEESKALTKAQQEASKASKEACKARLAASAPQDARDELRAALEAQNPRAIQNAWNSANFTYAPRAKVSHGKLIKLAGLEEAYQSLGLYAGKSKRHVTRATEGQIIALQIQHQNLDGTWDNSPEMEAYRAEMARAYQMVSYPQIP
jgi:hypothetical protein